MKKGILFLLILLHTIVPVKAQTYVTGTSAFNGVLPAGTVTAPSISFTGATNTGMYYTAGAINFGVASSLKASVTSTSFTLTGISVDPSATANAQSLGTTSLRWAQTYYDSTLTAGGTTGAQTINKNLGSVNFAAAAASLVVTNSRASATSLILLTPQTNDATCKSFAITRAAGSFTITANAACTAETAVAFFVMN